jgi:alpha-galactosidase
MMKGVMSMSVSRPPSRRDFLLKAGTAIVATGFSADSSVAQQAHSVPATTYLDLLRQPDAVIAYSALDHASTLIRTGPDWRGGPVHVEVTEQQRGLSIQVECPDSRLSYLHFRWRAEVAPTLLCLGDAWERSYGDLEWRIIVPNRVMPWYFLTFDGECVHGYGLKTGAGSLGFWQVDPEGVSLWLNLCNGGSGVLLGERRLAAASIVARKGEREEEPVLAAREFCRMMCPSPRLMQGPAYGSNDWYYAYGNGSPDQILHDADLVSSLRPPGAARPFTVIDEGWENRYRFTDMPGSAEEIRKRGVRPGIWHRALLAPDGTIPNMLLPAARFGDQAPQRSFEQAYDPTIPEALEEVCQELREIISWGFELLKHDYSTYDLLGRFGFEMGAQPAVPGWSFYDQTRTNAEIILDFYRTIRHAVGEQVIILGCTTVGHLSAGIFELQRIGDDTSGQNWERTRRMGVNTLAYRLPQHRSFFVADPDCVPITAAIPWDKTRQWLDLVAQSGTALFISPQRTAVGSEQRQALARAFELAASNQSAAVPADWFHDTTPEAWKLQSVSQPTYSSGEIRYQWCAPDGGYPFQV